MFYMSFHRYPLISIPLILSHHDCPHNLAKVIATATRTVRAASSAEPTTARELSSRRTTIAARTSVTAGTAVAAKNILAGKVKGIATVILSVGMASSADRTIARRGRPLTIVTTAASRSALLVLTPKMDRVSPPAPLLEAPQEAWNASFPSNTAVRTQKGLFFKDDKALQVSPTTPVHLWTTTTGTGATLKVDGAIVAPLAQVKT